MNETTTEVILISYVRLNDTRVYNLLISPRQYRNQRYQQIASMRLPKSRIFRVLAVQR